MTFVIGLVYVDGVVIACDSQVEFHRGAPVKRVNANKIHKLNGNIAIAGAGMVTFVNKAINGIRNTVRANEQKKKAKLTIEEIADCAEVAMINIHKKYDIQRIKFLKSVLTEQKMQEVVNVIMMMVGVEKHGKNIKKTFIFAS